MTWTQEQRREYLKQWRINNRTRHLEWQRQYRVLVQEPKRKLLRFGNRKCRSCEILLAYKAARSKHYCGDCIQEGFAYRHWHTQASKRAYEKQKALQNGAPIASTTN